MKYTTIAITLLALILAAAPITKAQEGEAFIDQATNPGITHGEAITSFTGQYISLPGELEGPFPIPLSAYNEATLKQTGNFNTARIRQLGYLNKAHLIQKGNGSTGILNLVGLGNKVKTTQHHHSWLKVTLTGIGNELSFDQPSNSSVLFNVRGLQNKFKAVQNSGTVNLYRKGGGGNPMTVSSTSRPIPVIISNGIY